MLSVQHARDLSLACEQMRRRIMPGGHLILIEFFLDSPKRGLPSVLIDELVVSRLRHFGAVCKTTHQVGSAAVLKFLTWRALYAASIGGRRHMKSDYANGRPPTLGAWRDALSQALPGGKEWILLGGLLAYNWANAS